MSTTVTGGLTDLITEYETCSKAIMAHRARIAAIEEEVAQLDLSKLRRLELSGDPNVDYAWYLVLKTLYGAKGQITAFPGVLAKIKQIQATINGWESGGIMLVDLTTFSEGGPCLSFVVLEVPPNPVAKSTATSGYFDDIPVSFRVPGRLIMAWQSSTFVWTSKYPSAEEYELTNDGRRLSLVDPRLGEENIQTTYDLTELFHPNWGTQSGGFTRIALGDEAIVSSIARWRSEITENQYIDAKYGQFLVEFLDEFLRAVEKLH